MSNYDRYSKCLVRSVSHIFKHFLDDQTIEEVFETQSCDKDHKVTIEITGTIQGEIVINLPKKTLTRITKSFLKGDNPTTLKRRQGEIAGEIANMITATFVNQLQYADHDLQLTPPEFNDDPITMKALYDNINVSFMSTFGGFDIDLYYKEK
jgi:CheY-specific phosphatase CheX